MHLPEGKGGTEIDSEMMLKENSPIIGISEWDNIQCRNFKGEDNGITIGDIVMVRVGNTPLALCEILDDYFTDKGLESKYINNLFRHVKILDWNITRERNSLFSQGTLKPLYKENDTPSWHYINNWYKRVLKNNHMNNLIDIIKAKHQIILQGAPGTGKTYTAKDVAEQLIFGKTSETKQEQKEKLENSEQYKLVQFHPSYSYEDFVRGIVVETETGVPNYKTIDKILGEFAKKALRNWEYSKKTVEEISKEQGYEEALNNYKEHINEKLANGEEFKILGPSAHIIQIDNDSFRYSFKDRPGIIYTLLFSDIIKVALNIESVTKRADIENLGLKMKGKSLYYYYFFQAFQAFIEDRRITIGQVKQKIEEKSYILVVDEINRANLPAVLGELIYALEYRGESVESMYAIDGENKLMLPPNLYIIGTMNTADRSVGQIDYAIRRRFAFIDMLPQALNDVDGFDFELFEKVSKLFVENYDEYKNNVKVTLKRSEYLSEEFRPEDVWLGHSYFIMKKEGKDNRYMRLNYEIKPILKEYLKDGILKSSAEEIINSLL